MPLFSSPNFGCPLSLVDSEIHTVIPSNPALLSWPQTLFLCVVNNLHCRTIPSPYLHISLSHILELVRSLESGQFILHDSISKGTLKPGSTGSSTTNIQIHPPTPRKSPQTRANTTKIDLKTIRNRRTTPNNLYGIRYLFLGFSSKACTFNFNPPNRLRTHTPTSGLHRRIQDTRREETCS